MAQSILIPPSALWPCILITAPSALRCPGTKTMVQCKPRPWGISQGKRGAACRIRHSHQKVSWSAASASCCSRRALAVLLQEGGTVPASACCKKLCGFVFRCFFFNLSRLHPLALSKPETPCVSAGGRRLLRGGGWVGREQRLQRCQQHLARGRRRVDPSAASVPELAGLRCHCKSWNSRIFMSEEPVL